MLFAILNQMSSISESIIIANFVVASFETKSKKHKLGCTFLLACLLYIDIFFLNEMVIHNENIIAIIQIAICFVFEMLFLTGSLYKKLLIPLLSTILTLLINMFLLIFFSSIYHIDYHYITDHGYTISFMIVFFSRILYFFSTTYIISVQHKNEIQLSKNEWLGITMIYISTLCVGCSVFTMSIQMNDLVNSYVVIIIIGLVMINLFSFYFIRKLSKDKLEKARYSILELQYENQKKDVIALNQQYSEMMKLRHDFKNYLLCCQTLINEQKYEEAGRYLNILSQDKINQSNYVRYSENNALNAILNAKINLCHEKKIPASCNITTSCKDIDEIDLSILLANLFDNAIEACSNNKNKSKIELSMSREKSYLHIQVKNSIDKSVLDKNPKLKTSKHDKANHGYGIQTITDIVNKYDGMLEFYEENHYFIADLWLKEAKIT